MNSALTLDIAFARKVLEHLIAHPEEHSQAHFGVQYTCKTTTCIAGTAVLMDPRSTVRWGRCDLIGGGQAKAMTSVWVDGERMNVEHRAAQLLGLDGDDANRLFYNMHDAEALGLLASYIEQATVEQNR